MAARLRTAAPVWVVGLLGLLGVWYFGEGPNQQLMTLTFIWAAFALGWNIIGGYGGQLSAGHAAFFGIGAYVPTLIFDRWGITPALGIWVGIVVAVLAALLIGWPTFRLAGVYFTLATLAYPLIAMPVLDWLGLQEVSLPFIRENAAWYFQFSSPRGASLLALTLLVVVLGVTVAVDRSRLGLMLRAVKGNQPAAEASGVDTLTTKMRGFALSAAISAAAGTLYTTSVLFVVTPASVFGILVSVTAIIIPIVGGVATVLGPVIGAALLIPLEDILGERYGAELPGLNGVLFGVALILTVLFAPGGIYGRLKQGAAALWARRSARSTGERPAVAAAGPTVVPAGAPVGGGLVPPASPGAAAVSAVAQRDGGDRGAPSGSGEVVLKTVDLTRTYGGLHAVNRVSIEVVDGELLGIIGPNGAGKTTLFDVVNGLVPPTSGAVYVGDHDITHAKPHQVCRLGVARTFQVVRTFHDMSLLENVTVGALSKFSSARAAKEAALDALEKVGLAGAADRPASSLNTAALRRMEFARALVGEPHVLLADECLAGLSGEDVRAVVDLLRTIRESGVTVVVIEHTMSAMVELVDRFVVLDHGAVIATGAPSAIVQDPRVIEAYLGRRWARHEHAER